MLITGDGEIVLGLDLDSTKTGGIVEFRRQIVLLQRSSAGILGARRRGSIIWDDVEPVRLILEADHVRFPVEQVDFSKMALIAMAFTHSRLRTQISIDFFVELSGLC